MQDTLAGPPEGSHNKKWLMVLLHYVWYRGIRLSIGTALVLLAWDAMLTGSFLMSYIICPIWFLLSIVKNAAQRPGWRLTFFRTTIPALTLGLVLINNAVQLRMAKANAAAIVTACEEFHAGNSRYPRALDELVPQYMPSVPRAKHCLIFGDFLYWNFDGEPLLAWYAIPPYGRKIYNFEEQRWSYLD